MSDRNTKKAGRNSRCSLSHPVFGSCKGCLLRISRFVAASIFPNVIFLVVLLTCHHAITDRDSAIGWTVEYGEGKLTFTVEDQVVCGCTSCCGPDGILGEKAHPKLPNTEHDDYEGHCPFLLDFTLVLLNIDPHCALLEIHDDGFDTNRIIEEINSGGLLCYKMNKQILRKSLMELLLQVENNFRNICCIQLNYHEPSHYTLHRFVTQLKQLVTLKYQSLDHEMEEGDSGTPIYQNGQNVMFMHIGRTRAGKNLGTLIPWICTLVTIRKQSREWPIRLLYSIYIMYHIDLQCTAPADECEGSVIQKTAEAILQKLSKMELDDQTLLSTDHGDFLLSLVIHILEEDKDSVCHCRKIELRIVFTIIEQLYNCYRKSKTLKTLYLKKIIHYYEGEYQRLLEDYLELEPDMEKNGDDYSGDPDMKYLQPSQDEFSSGMSLEPHEILSGVLMNAGTAEPQGTSEMVTLDAGIADMPQENSLMMVHDESVSMADCPPFPPGDDKPTGPADSESETDTAVSEDVEENNYESQMASAAVNGTTKSRHSIAVFIHHSNIQ